MTENEDPRDLTQPDHADAPAEADVPLDDYDVPDADSLAEADIPLDDYDVPDAEALAEADVPLDDYDVPDADVAAEDYDVPDMSEEVETPIVVMDTPADATDPMDMPDVALSENVEVVSEPVTPPTIPQPPAAPAPQPVQAPVQAMANNNTSNNPPSPTATQAMIAYDEYHNNVTRADHYVKTRWEGQKSYYSKKAGATKQRYQSIQLVIALGGATVPVLISLPLVPQIVPIVISLVVAMATAIEAVYSYGDDWRSFRQVSEGLKRERALFESGAGPYRRTKMPHIRFVERCEDIIAEETGRYFERQDKEDEEDATPTPPVVPGGLPQTTPAATAGTPGADAANLDATATGYDDSSAAG